MILNRSITFFENLLYQKLAFRPPLIFKPNKVYLFNLHYCRLLGVVPVWRISWGHWLGGVICRCLNQQYPYENRSDKKVKTYRLDHILMLMIQRIRREDGVECLDKKSLWILIKNSYCVGTGYQARKKQKTKRGHRKRHVRIENFDSRSRKSKICNTRLGLELKIIIH